MTRPTSDQDWERPARARLVELLPRGTLVKVAALLFLLAGVVYLRAHADRVIGVLGPAGIDPTGPAPVQPTAKGRENRHDAGRPSTGTQAVPSSPR